MGAAGVKDSCGLVMAMGGLPASMLLIPGTTSSFLAPDELAGLCDVVDPERRMS